MEALTGLTGGSIRLPGGKEPFRQPNGLGPCLPPADFVAEVGDHFEGGDQRDL
jgi:hypothetical protein